MVILASAAATATDDRSAAVAARPFRQSRDQATGQR